MSYRLLFLSLVVVSLSTLSCKRCYQCAVKDSSTDELQWAYKQVCASKSAYEDYKSVCEASIVDSNATTVRFYCDCGEDISLE
jgi:hypothetical protein